ncbi:hypothetical protein MLD38_031071 [Melastoma candidum]|uniref:Uncharacterized protein n=1 Tax=Melastoma candidum TaxID=119954 RepID=A0ACB9MP48_9MYRT|nr:hypothetical protein MLD38_031071 [Melastoma candidum]
MASAILSVFSSPVASLSCPVRPRTSVNQLRSACAMGNGLRLAKVQGAKLAKGVSPAAPRYRKTVISCSLAGPETLKDVQRIIAKQLSIDESTVTPDTKFADLGADSLDIVEIMMALEEKFSVSIGEGGAENISTVQEAADLIEKVKAST